MILSACFLVAVLQASLQYATGINMIKCLGNKILRRFDKELLCIEPWGENSFRVRATQRHEFLTEDNGALLDPAVCESKV